MEDTSSSLYGAVPQVLLSAAELIRYRDDGKPVFFTLVNGQTLQGTIGWFDAESIHVTTTENSEVTLLKHAILFYSAK